MRELKSQDDAKAFLEEVNYCHDGVIEAVRIDAILEAVTDPGAETFAAKADEAALDQGWIHDSSPYISSHKVRLVFWHTNYEPHVQGLDRIVLTLLDVTSMRVDNLPNYDEMNEIGIERTEAGWDIDVDAIAFFRCARIQVEITE